MAKFKAPVNVKGTAVGIDQVTSKPQDIVCSSLYHYLTVRISKRLSKISLSATESIMWTLVRVPDVSMMRASFLSETSNYR